MPLTPGILSEASPINDNISKTFLGPTSNFSITCSIPIIRFFIESYMWIFSPTSCIKSLSDETIKTSYPSDSAFLAMVAMMSSASNPIFSSIDKFNDSALSRTIENCGINSSGQVGRLAL